MEMVEMRQILMIPGLCSDAAIWRRTISALGSDFRCVVGDTLQDPTLPGMARRILDGAPDKFALAGVSMGGMVAMELLRLAPSRVTHLALIDTNARPDILRQKIYRSLANMVVGMTSDFRPLAKRSLPTLVHPDVSEDVKSEMIEMSVRVGPKTYVRQNRAVSTRRDLREILPQIAVPTAVIVGEEDVLIPVAMSREIHDLTPGSTLHIIPGCGHLPPIEKPAIVADLLRKLTQEH
jgi:pimeloyl-ACP methyl ester carboxylesterase